MDTEVSTACGGPSTEWAYEQPYGSNQQRLDSLPDWLHDYNWHRLHTEVGEVPATRLPVNTVCVKDT